MKNRYKSLDEIMSSLLFNEITEPLKKAPKVHYDIEVEKFKEIIQFVKENNREPYKVNDNLTERSLASRLAGIRKDVARLEYLLPFDEVGLLNKVEKVTDVLPKINSISDILEKGSSELLGIALDGNTSIFDTATLEKVTTMPDYVAKRKKNKDFGQYEGLFKRCQTEITEGKRKITPFFNEQDIQEGSFYVLKGVLLYVEKVGERQKVKGKTNARLKCIFENGTESDMLLRSLSAELYKHGRRVTDTEDSLLENLENPEQPRGEIYVLKSLSEDPQIKAIKNLYKIGYTKNGIQIRIQNAANESTYLYAPVEVVALYDVYNMGVNEFERALHHVLAHKNLDVTIMGANGKMIVPKEWFVAELEEIQEAINQIVLMVQVD